MLHSMNLSQQTPSTNPPSDADVFELLDRFADAFNRHDLDALMSMMTADCVFEAPFVTRTGAAPGTSSPAIAASRNGPSPARTKMASVWR
jgi:ketosteroid isomerase-like protein